MNITLNKPFAGNAPVDESDVRAVKIALNRLGFYTPVKKIGITDIPDAAVFDALKAFQNDKGLKPTGEIRQDDETLKALNEDIEQTKNDQYIWVTVGDNAVRDSHQELDGQIRSFDEDPTPGSEPNCRCSAVPIPSKKPEKKPDCEEERKAYEDAVESFQRLDQRNKQIKQELNELRQRLENITTEVRNIWITTGISSLLPRVSGQIAGNMLQARANMLQKELQKEKLELEARKKHIEAELVTVTAELTKVSQEVLRRKQELEECERRQKD